MEGLEEQDSLAEQKSGLLSGKFWLFALAVAALVLLAVYLLSGRVSNPPVALPDGTSCRLAATTYGKTHQLGFLSPIERLLSRLPNRVVTSFGLAFPSSSPLKFTTTNDSLAIWIVRDPPPTTGFSDFNVYLIDPEGRMNGVVHTSGTSTTTNEEIRGYLFKAFPRRTKNFLVVLTLRNSATRENEVVGKFQIANPAWQKNFPVWKPAPLPLTHQSGDLEFTLVKLSTESSFRDRSKPATNPWDRATSAEFEIRQRGQLLTNWQPVKVFIHDATGNEAENRSWSNSSQDGRQKISFEGALDFTEPAWKLRVEFSRTSAFTPQETWTISGISTNLISSTFLPPNAPSLARTNLFGATLELAGLRRRYDGYRQTPIVNVQFRIQSPRPDYRFSAVAVTDDQGRPLRRSGSSWSDTSADYDFESFDDTQSLNITVAYHPSRVVEFTTRPEPDKAQSK